MKRLIIASLLATAAAATPAAARDGSWYAGIEGGFLWAKDMSADLEFDGGDIDDFVEVNHGGGYDIDGIVGYDFGMFRAEGELAFKRAKHKDYSYTDYYGDVYDYDADGHTSVTSGMINLLFDAGNEDGFSFYAGPGIGIAKTKISVEADDFDGTDSISDSGFAWQAIAGIRYALSPNVDLGLKYRYFVGSRVKDDFDGSTGAELDAGRFKSSSLLASLVFNFAPPAPMPVAAPYVAPAPVVEPAPQMQTCYDGSMIPVTAVCPSPPAPVAPAPMPGERG